MERKGKSAAADKEKILDGANGGMSHHEHDENQGEERRRNDRRFDERRAGDDRRKDMRRREDREKGTESASVDRSAFAVSDEVKEKNEVIERLSKENESFKDLLQRRQADFENYKKRMLKYQEDQKRYGIKDFALDIIMINDDLIRAIEAASNIDNQGEEASRSFIEGVSMISKRIEETLKVYGVVEIESLGLAFNPNFHEAVEIELSENYPADTVTKVHQKGFRIDDMVVRSNESEGGQGGFCPVTSDTKRRCVCDDQQTSNDKPDQCIAVK